MSTSVSSSQPDLTPQTIMDRLRRQLDADCEMGLIDRCSDEMLNRVVTDAVTTLWERSRIKVYLPVLALRQAREEIRTLAAA